MGRAIVGAPMAKHAINSNNILSKSLVFCAPLQAYTTMHAATLYMVALTSTMSAWSATGLEMYLHNPSREFSRSHYERICYEVNGFVCKDIFETGVFGELTDSASRQEIATEFGGLDFGSETLQEFNNGVFHTRALMTRANEGSVAAALVSGRSLSGTPSREKYQTQRRAPYHLAYMNEGVRRECVRTGCTPPPTDTYQYTRTGRNVTVYLLGEPLDSSHPEISGRSANSFGPESPESVCSTWHGTHVAALVNGLHHGVAKDANVRSVSVTAGCREPFYTIHFLRGLQHIINERRALTVSAPATLLIVPRAPVKRSDQVAIHMIEDMVRTLVGLNVSVVSGAGSFEANACDYSPQRLPEVLTIASIEVYDDKGYLMSQPWRKTNFGECVDAWAPGVEIESAFFAGRSRSTAVYSGSTQAAALVSGVIAQILESEPSLTPGEIRNRIEVGASSPSLLSYTRPRTTWSIIQTP